MSSNISVTQIDENFPKPGINQSSQQFRTNFDVIKRNLLISKTEITDLHTKKIEITGDATGISGVLGSGTIQPTPINLTLSDTGVTAGTYGGNDKRISLSVDNKGRITTILETSDQTYNVEGTYNSTITNYAVSTGLENYAGTQSINVPSFELNEYGQIVNVSSTQLTGFGLLGHPVAEGALVVGNSLSKSSLLSAPYPNTGELYVLSVDRNLPEIIVWKKLELPTGSITEVQEGIAIDVSNSTTNPEISLNIKKLDNGIYPTIDPNDLFVIYSNTDNQHKVIPWNSLNLSLNYLEKIQDDTAPILGGNLDVKNFKITSSNSAGVQIEGGNGNIRLNGMKWPSVSGINESVLSNDGSGNLYWRTLTTNNGTVTEITTGVGLRTNPTTGISTTGQINLSLRDLNESVPVPLDDYIPAVRMSDNSHIRFSLNTIQVNSPLMFCVSVSGNDTTGNGSLNQPFKTITKALSMVPLTNSNLISILIMPGIYFEDVTINKNQVSIKGLSGKHNTIISGKITISAGLISTILEDLTVDITSQGLLSSGRSLDIPNGCDDIIVNNCRFLRLSDNEEDMLINIELSGTQNGIIRFNNCEISGYVRNNITGSDDLQVEFNNIVGSFYNKMGIITEDNTETFISNVNYFGGVHHNGGILSLSNISELIGDDEFNINSTANSGKLVMKNCSLKFYENYAAEYAYAIINKTGTCDYLLINVDRNFTNDILTGNRLDYGGSLGVDTGEPVITDTISTSYTIDVNKSAVWDLSLSGDTTITLTADNISGKNYGRSITVVLRQTTGDNTVLFTATGGIIWSGNNVQPSISSASGKITVFTFLKVSDNWIGGRAVYEA